MPTKIIPCDLTVNGLVTATKFIIPGGTSTLFLKADGTLDNTTQKAIDKVDSKLMYVESIPEGETADDYTAIQIEKDGASVTVYFRKSDLLDLILDNEKVIAAALNDLNSRVTTNTTNITSLLNS